HAALFCFRLQPTWRLGRGVQSVVIFHAKRRPQGHLQCLQNVSFVKGGGETTITPKRLSILHAITLQECRVFERYGVKINFNESQPRNSSAANVSASSVNIEGKL